MNISDLAWAAITEYHELGRLRNRSVFPHSSEAGSPRSECQHSQVLVRLSFLAADSCVLAVPSHGREKESKLSGVSSYEVTKPIMRVPTSLLHLNQIISRRPILYHDIGG